MGVQLWKSLMVLSIFLLRLKNIRVFADPQVPCLFFFGDSYFDNGNNNILMTQARSDFLPYGIDFQNSQPTGRFTNDMNLADFTAKLLGFPDFIPAFASGTVLDILRGVNYASGFSGIGLETGRVRGAVISLVQQLRNHDIIISRIKILTGSTSSAEELLNKCIYNFHVGSNDYLDYYFFPPRLQRAPFQLYTSTLVRQLRSNLEQLYRVGARKVVVYGLPLIGCIPFVRSFDYRRSCDDEMNTVTNLFNDYVKSELIQLINSRALVIPTGDLVADTPCCDVSRNNQICVSGSDPCTKRDQYVYYDGVHPSNATYYLAALHAYDSVVPDAAFPYSIRQLALL